MASALAGPAAGLAVAADIQRKNAESRIDPEEAAASVRQQKAAWKSESDMLAQKILSECSVTEEEARAARKAADDLRKKIDRCELLLVDDATDQYQLMEMLDPSISSLTISESGSVHISVKITGAYFDIFENVAAVIDGSFRAMLWNENGECCGTAALVLPVYGADKDMELEAWFTEPNTHEANYSVEFTKPNLWLIEAFNAPSTSKRSTISPLEKGYSENTIAYFDALELMKSIKIECVSKALEIFRSLGDWRDSPKKVEICAERYEKLEALRVKLEEEKKQKAKEQEIESQREEERNKKENAIKAEKLQQKLIIEAVVLLAVLGYCVLSLISVIASTSCESFFRVMVGILLMLLGGPAVCLYGNRNKEESSSGCFPGILTSLGGILIGIGSTRSSDAPNGNFGMVSIGLVMIAVGIVMFGKSILTYDYDELQKYKEE